MIHAYQYALRDIAGLPTKYKYSQPTFQKKLLFDKLINTRLFM